MELNIKLVCGSGVEKFTFRVVWVVKILCWWLGSNVSWSWTSASSLGKVWFLSFASFHLLLPNLHFWIYCAFVSLHGTFSLISYKFHYFMNYTICFVIYGIFYHMGHWCFNVYLWVILVWKLFIRLKRWKIFYKNLKMFLWFQNIFYVLLESKPSVILYYF